MKFCDYCPCHDCEFGTSYISHAKTIDEKWICDTCWLYEVCQNFPERQGLGPCDGDCDHRPKLVTDWK